jgi:DNA-binding beta-propeller fold protein YncE
MRPALRLAAGLGLLLALAALGACAPAQLKPEEQARLVWPDLPNPPRIAYVRQFSKPDDFGISKGLFQRIGDLIFGGNESRLIRPMAVVANASAVFVADPGSNGVHRFDQNAARYDLIFAEGGLALPSPVGLALGAQGEVYVADSDLAKVLVIRPGAKFATPLALPELSQPSGLAFDRNTGNLYVVDTGEHRVKVFGRDGALAFSFGGRGDGAGEFNYPTLMWLDAAGRLYVTDSLNFRIQMFDRQGKYLSRFGQVGDGSGDNIRPKAVATDSMDHVYVVDALHNALQIYDLQGRYLLSVGSVGGDRGEFWLPAGIFIDEADTIYIADSYNQRVQVFRYIGGPK